MGKVKIGHNLCYKIFIAAIYFIIVYILYRLKVPCVFQYFFHIPCLGCGMTRAFISALRLDFLSAFKYHPMFWSVPFIFLYLFVDGNLFGEKADRVMLCLFGMGFVINWIIKLV